MMAASVLVSAGYSAATGSNADMADRSTLNLMASSSYLEGKTTLTLYGNTSHHLGVAPEIYEAALIRGDRNPTVAEVEGLVARVIMSKPFQDYAQAVSPRDMPETRNLHIAQADVDATCNRSHKPTKTPAK
jgi:hypothetical protein